MNRDPLKDRAWRYRGAQKYHDKVHREVLAGERPWNSVPPVNRERRAKLHERNFGLAKRAWLTGLPCCVCGSPSNASPWSSTEACHVKSRGAGGDSTSLVPMCHHHHVMLHEWGIKTFQAFHGIDLHALAAEYERRWQEEQR